MSAESAHSDNGTQKRECGGCSACCKTHSVDEIGKPFARWCEHCKPGKGCAIYTRRPFGCQSFACLWLKGNGSEHDRPDRTRVVIDEAYPAWARGGVAQLFEVMVGSLDSAYALSVTKEYLDLGKVVTHLTLNGNHTLFIPESMPELDQLHLKSLGLFENFKIVS